MTLVLPMLIPLVTAAVSLLAWRRPALQQWLGVVGAAGLLGAAILLVADVGKHGIQVEHVGGWSAPFGITLVADRFSSLMVLLGGIVGLAGAVYSQSTIDPPRQPFAYYPVYHVLLTGVCGAFLAGDLFNLYVWFEVLLIASFVLMALGGDQPQLEGALKYVTLNLISSFLFLTAVGLLYGALGTLNMADAADRLGRDASPGLGTALAMLFLVAFGIKAAMFPLFFWLPASYHTPPAVVSAVFAGLLTKVGVYALIRVFTLIFVHDVGRTHGLILAIAALTMVCGVLGAMTQNEFRRILSFHIVSQIGYMILGLGLFTPLALAGSVFYIAHHIIVKTSLFLVSGIACGLQQTGELSKMGGLYRQTPWLALLFAIPALSLAGVPPLSGFVAKLILIRAGMEAGEFAVVGVAIFVGLLTLYSMAKIWNAAFWGEPPQETTTQSGGISLQSGRMFQPLWHALPVACLASLTILIGLLAGPAFAWSEAAANELLNPAAANGYMERVGRQTP